VTNRIVAALRHSATKLGKTLGDDAGNAVKDLYRSTGHHLTGIAEDTAATDTEHATVLSKLMRDGKEDAPTPPHNPGEGSHLPHEDGRERPLGGEHAPGQPSEGNGGCTTGGDPVDVVSGQMITSATDVDLPGLLPLVLRRAYASGYAGGRWFGLGWSGTLDQRVQVDAGGIHYAGEDAEIQTYPLPTTEAPRVLPERGPRRPLTWDRESDTIRIEDTATGWTRHFAPPEGRPGARTRTITALSDRNGHRVEYLPGPDGLPAEVRHSGGYAVAVDTVGTPAGPRIAGLRLLSDDVDGDPRRTGGAPNGDGDPAGVPDRGEGIPVVRYTYDERGRLTGVTDSTGLPLAYAYDAHDRITSWTDRNGHWYAYEYGPDGRVTHGHGPRGALEAHFTYDLAARVTTVTDSLGAATVYHYDQHGHLTAVTDPLGGTVHTAHDRHGRLLAYTDALGAVSRLARDGQGDVVRVDRPDGTAVRVAYNALRLPVEVRTPDGGVWRHSYDERGNRTALTDVSGATTRFSYDPAGRLTSVTDAAGHTTHARCTPAGLLGEAVDPRGGRTAYRYDAFGRPVTVTDPLGNATGYDWSPEGRLRSRVQSDGARDTWDYDAEGNPVRHTDPLGAVTSLAYTHFDLVTERTDPDGARYAFAYDSELRLLQVTQPQGLTWTYRRDDAGRVISETDFDGRTLSYTHDAAGQLTARTNGLGQTIGYRLDPLGRLLSKDADGHRTEYTYDGAGRLLSARDDTTELARGYDPVGRLLAESVDGRTTTFTYDPLGRPVQRRTPSGSVSRWTYDPAGNPASLETAAGHIAFDHDALGQETVRHLGADLRLALTWDASYRLTDQELSTTSTAAAPEPLLRRSYAYRPDGNLAARTDRTAGRPADTTRFDLDPVGRVTAVHGGNWTERYTYDQAGHLTTADAPAPGPGGEPGAAARPRGYDGPRAYDGARLRTAGRLSYAYDRQGRVTRRRHRSLSGKTRTWHYTWDAEDHLTDVTTPDGAHWHYRYDPLGRRITKQHLSADGAAPTVQERTDFTWHGHTLVEQTAHGPHLPGPYTLTWDYRGLHPIAQNEQLAAAEPRDGQPDAADVGQDEIDRTFFAIVTDLVGTPTHLYAPDGTTAWQQRTTLWGAPAHTAGPQTTTPLRQPGQYWDPESQLHYNVHRYYDPATARYLTPDPLGLAPSPDPYTYVPNPLQQSDPLGLAGCGTGPDFIGPQDHVALGRDMRGDINVRDFSDRVSARHLMNSADWRAGVDGAVARLGRGEGRISFMLDGLPGANRGPAVALQRAQEAAAANNGSLMATQWELLQVHHAGLMDQVDFYRWNRKLNDWGAVR
jgi:RHS repeat-associated protein